MDFFFKLLVKLDNNGRKTNKPKMTHLHVQSLRLLHNNRNIHTDTQKALGCLKMQVIRVKSIDLLRTERLVI